MTEDLRKAAEPRQNPFAHDDALTEAMAVRLESMITNKPLPSIIVRRGRYEIAEALAALAHTAAEASLAAVTAERDALLKATTYAGEAIDTGRSEPLFIARDLIRNTLADLKEPTNAE